MSFRQCVQNKCRQTKKMSTEMSTAQKVVDEKRGKQLLLNVSFWTVKNFLAIFAN